MSLLKKFNQKEYDYKGANQWESTGNIAVDMVATCVSMERKHKRPIKGIFLNKYYWDYFFIWLSLLKRQKKLTEEQLTMAEEQGFLFDDVEIKRSDIMTGGHPLHVVYWDPVNTPANAVN